MIVRGKFDRRPPCNAHRAVYGLLKERLLEGRYAVGRDDRPMIRGSAEQPSVAT